MESASRHFHNLNVTFVSMFTVGFFAGAVCHFFFIFLVHECIVTMDDWVHLLKLMSSNLRVLLQPSSLHMASFPILFFLGSRLVCQNGHQCRTVGYC
jgi:hypothetical protein